jgi:ABC-type sugar transport system substrate-binding protein
VVIAKQMHATIAQDPYGTAKTGVEQAVAKVKGTKVRRNVNTGNPLVTQKNAQAYFTKAEKKLGGPAGSELHKGAELA